MKILRPNGYKNTPSIRYVTCHMHVKKKFLQNKILFSVLAHYLAKRKFPPKTFLEQNFVNTYSRHGSKPLMFSEVV